MKNKLLTKRYGQWSGNPNGEPYNPDRCVKEVFNKCNGFVSSQCSRKNGHGEDGLFCKQHKDSTL